MNLSGELKDRQSSTALQNQLLGRFAEIFSFAEQHLQDERVRDVITNAAVNPKLRLAATETELEEKIAGNIT